MYKINFQSRTGYIVTRCMLFCRGNNVGSNVVIYYCRKNNCYIVLFIFIFVRRTYVLRCTLTLYVLLNDPLEFTIRILNLFAFTCVLRLTQYTNEIHLYKIFYFLRILRSTFYKLTSISLTQDIIILLYEIVKVKYGFYCL